MDKLVFSVLCSCLCFHAAFAQDKAGLTKPSAAASVFLSSGQRDLPASSWQMIRFADAGADGKTISSGNYATKRWLPATVPGTVLSNLVTNKVYPEPYYGDNNRKSRGLIPDIAEAGREFYHYWFRKSFVVPAAFKGKRLWLKFHGINYRTEIWLNGQRIGQIAGMFQTQSFDITDIATLKGKNVLAVDVQPVDHPGTTFKPGKAKTGAVGENHNGGDGEIGKNVTMLMSVGWDFTAHDGIRDRNTGIWRDVELYATGDVLLEHPFIYTKLPLPDTSSAQQTVSVEIKNASNQSQRGILYGHIRETGGKFSRELILAAKETKTITFLPKEFEALNIRNPKLWWPINKGAQNLYTLSLEFKNTTGRSSHRIATRFGIREVSTDQNTPDGSRRFLVNGHPVFIRGTNWIPEAMLRNDTARTRAELRYTRQAGLNLIRLWGGGITESDYFYQLCDTYGFLVWNEFWVTADTRMPVDTSLYFQNVASAIKRLRNHPSIAYYVGANEGKEVPGTGKFIATLDPTRGYQEQSECCGIHDGSPYKYENPMQYFENTASQRGSRVDGFNPEYGTLSLPVLSSLKKMMPAKDLWPPNDSVWNYLDGNGFHGVTGKYRKAVEAYGKSGSIAEYAKKAQLVGALNFRAIWEVWNDNKFGYGDRWASGFLFWYHNSPLPQTASRMYDWYLQPTAALYYSQNGLAPLHAQYDYLRNTVSVYNDFRQAYSGYQLEATVYDFNTRQVWNRKTKLDIPADGLVKNAIQIEFPSGISQVHFIKLTLTDNKGKLVNDAFYWRSKDRYEGAWTMTGPAVSGFSDIDKLPKAQLKVLTETRVLNGKAVLQVAVSNPSKHLCFFTELKLQDEKGGAVAPAFYSDNFFSLLPGESKNIRIELPEYFDGKKKWILVTAALNTTEITNPIKN